MLQDLPLTVEAALRLLQRLVTCSTDRCSMKEAPNMGCKYTIAMRHGDGSGFGKPNKRLISAVIISQTKYIEVNGSVSSNLEKSLLGTWWFFLIGRMVMMIGNNHSRKRPKNCYVSTEFGDGQNAQRPSDWNDLIVCKEAIKSWGSE